MRNAEHENISSAAQVDGTDFLADLSLANAAHSSIHSIPAIQVPSATSELKSSSNNSSSSHGQWLCFKLGAQEYGVDILCVQEIRSFEQPTSIVNTPGYVLGVLNLRGEIVPVIDMRVKLNLGEAKYGALTALIVLILQDRAIAMVVDAVSDVVTLTPEQIRPLRAFTSDVVDKHLLGIASFGTRKLVLLDAERVITSPCTGPISRSLQ